MKDYEKLSREHFNRQAAGYDRNRSVGWSGPAKISCAHAAAWLEGRTYRDLLDVGCGTGWLIALLAAKKPARYCGVDLAEEMVRMAREKEIPGAEFTVGSAMELPYPDGSFQVVTCIQSFHHYPRPDRAMEEAFRVLAPGGIYLLSDTGVGGLAAWVDNHLIFPLMNTGDCHTDNKDGISRRMERAGFRVMEKRQLKGFIYTVVGRKE